MFYGRTYEEVKEEPKLNEKKLLAQTVNSNSNVTLDEIQSFDPDGDPISYNWSQVLNGAPLVTLSDPTFFNPTFTAPVTTGNIKLIFTLIVTDSNQAVSRASNVVITVKKT